MTEPVRGSELRGWLAGALLLAACAGQTSPVVTRPETLPAEQPARAQKLTEIGRRLFATLREGRPEQLVLDDLELGAVIEPAAVSRISLVRARGSALPPARELVAAFEGTTYAGACFDRARPEAPAGELGLRAPGFVFDRVLVAGREPGGGTVAAWLEGTFVVTDAGVWALLLSRVEEPRREHADLALQACDLRDQAK
jgi:hypothetical protein